jgi:hypothetical protein
MQANYKTDLHEMTILKGSEDCFLVRYVSEKSRNIKSESTYSLAVCICSKTRVPYLHIQMENSKFYVKATEFYGTLEPASVAIQSHISMSQKH